MRTSFATRFAIKNNFDENNFIKVIVSNCNLEYYKDFTNHFWQLYLYITSFLMRTGQLETILLTENVKYKIE